MILTAPNPFLSRRCRQHATVTLSQLTAMFRLVADAQALGLAAPQIGVDARLFVTYWGEVFIDPHLEEWSGFVSSVEGCLSIPGRQFQVPRYKRVKVNGKRYEGMEAIVIQHEMDHLNGILISDEGVGVEI